MKLRHHFLVAGALLVSFLGTGDLEAGPGPRNHGGQDAAGRARIQFLSPTLVRLEFSPTSSFVDQPTVVVQDRRRVEAHVSEQDGWLIERSEYITVRYRLGSGRFTKENLTLSWDFGGKHGTWSPGDEDTLNLGGVVVLDGVSGERLPPPQKGVLSRSGYFVLDDSQTPVMDSVSDWVAARSDRGNQDLYFLAYGRDYRHALREYSQLCGEIPMMPRYSLGIWMTDLNYEYVEGSDLITRYRYTSGDLESEITRFRAEGLPLDVLVLDFGWHNFGWQGGYDWSPVFKDPKGFLRWCHQEKLHVAVNDHPKNEGESALSPLDSHAEQAKKLLGRSTERRPESILSFPDRWRFKTDPTDTGMLASWYATALQDSGWGLLDGGKPWEDQGHRGHIGFGWYRKWIHVPATGAEHLYLVLGGAADQYDLYVNGKEAAHHMSAGNRSHNTLTCTDVTEFIEKGKANLLALRINAWSNYGGLTALPIEITDEVPPGLVQFNLADKREAEAFMTALHAPLMNDGVDFWWIDGSGACRVRGLNSQLWTNKIYYDFTQRYTGMRSLIFSRYAGWGSQRYPAFFTGDTYSEWPMLAYQVGATASAGNVLMPYVTHDIGGFHGDTLSAGLYCRWLEFGAFSPILRLHCAWENPANGNLRMPWVYGEVGLKVARRYFNLREQLLPYTYTLSRRAHDEALPLVRPLYLHYPDLEEAYQHPGEFLFGDDFLVSPVTDSTGLASTYLPPGRWIRFLDGKAFQGGRVVKETYALESMPLFVKAGSIIPMQPVRPSAFPGTPDTLLLQVFGPDSGTFNLYEDDGVSLEYARGGYSWTPISFSGGTAAGYHLSVGAAAGSFHGQAEKRAYRIRVRGIASPREVRMGDGDFGPGGGSVAWSWDERDSTAEITIPATGIRGKVEVTIR